AHVQLPKNIFEIGTGIVTDQSLSPARLNVRKPELSAVLGMHTQGQALDERKLVGGADSVSRRDPARRIPSVNEEIKSLLVYVSSGVRQIDVVLMQSRHDRS